MFRNNYKVLSPKHRQKKIKSKLKTNIAIGWMEVYFKRIGEKIPNTISVNQPCYLSQEKIYQETKRDLESTGDPCCRFSWFNHIWNEKFSNVHIPAVSFILCVILSVYTSQLTECFQPYSIWAYLKTLEHYPLSPFSNFIVFCSTMIMFGVV